MLSRDVIYNCPSIAETQSLPDSGHPCLVLLLCSPARPDDSENSP